MSPLSLAFRIGGTLSGLVGILVVFVGPVSTVKHGVVTGVAVFAVLYVIAQAVERIVEFVVALLRLIPDSPGQQVVAGLRELGKARFANTDSSVPQEKVDNGRSDVAFVGLGLSILLAGLAVNALNYGILNSLGTTGVDRDLDRLLTALAAAGGSKALHELVGRLQKAKEESAVAAKTA